MLRDYWLGWLKSRWVWALVTIVALWYFAPSVLSTVGGAAWSVTRSVFGSGTAIASDVYHAGHGTVTGRTDPGPDAHGRTHRVDVMVIFDVNRAYHGWGQIFRSFYQLPEITGRVYAARIIHGRVESLLPSDTSLLSQRRFNWHATTTARMRWNDVHATVGERSTHLCVDLWEASEGHNVLGHIDDALHLIHWDDAHLTSGDAPVAHGECVELDANGFPYDFPPTELTRPGEERPTGTLSVRWEGPNG
ncbi:hypothetical protein M0Q28_04245 [Patescibacteria group bacterium]|jgi:hypothetical protein|nr:hypothetical protein [Patescibacteria group bacterium]